MLFIGSDSRKGGVVDFKNPPIVVYSSKPINEYKNTVLGNHIDIKSLPVQYSDSKCFLILRPTALQYRFFVRELLFESGLEVSDEFELDNFMLLADVLYQLDLDKSYHWQWRVIMRVLHESGVQDQNKAFVFVLKYCDLLTIVKVSNLKNDIRNNIGETPVIVKHDGLVEIALGIHHLHSPDALDLDAEYNTLMHAKNKTSVFAF